MKYKTEPIKGQKFEWGRTINPFNCDCKVCTFMNCPKHNYAVKMKQHKYTIKEFVTDSKNAIKEKGGLWAYLKDGEGLMEFMDACIGGFPKGTYWQPTGYSVELVSMNRSKYGPDFDTRAEISFDGDFPYYFYSGCTDAQEKFTKRLQKKFLELKEVYNREN